MVRTSQFRLHQSPYPASGLYSTDQLTQQREKQVRADTVLERIEADTRGPNTRVLLGARDRRGSKRANMKRGAVHRSREVDLALRPTAHIACIINAISNHLCKLQYHISYTSSAHADCRQNRPKVPHCAKLAPGPVKSGGHLTLPRCRHLAACKCRFAAQLAAIMSRQSGAHNTSIKRQVKRRVSSPLRQEAASAGHITTQVVSSRDT